MFYFYYIIIYKNVFHISHNDASYLFVTAISRKKIIIAIVPGILTTYFIIVSYEHESIISHLQTVISK